MYYIQTNSKDRIVMRIEDINIQYMKILSEINNRINLKIISELSEFYFLKMEQTE